MTLVQFGIVTVLLVIAWYLINYIFPTVPRVVRIVLNVVLGLVMFFMFLALFNLMPLPFDLK